MGSRHFCFSKLPGFVPHSAQVCQPIFSLSSSLAEVPWYGALMFRAPATREPHVGPLETRTAHGSEVWVRTLRGLCSLWGPQGQILSIAITSSPLDVFLSFWPRNSSFHQHVLVALCLGLSFPSINHRIRAAFTRYDRILTWLHLQRL